MRASLIPPNLFLRWRCGIYRISAWHGRKAVGVHAITYHTAIEEGNKIQGRQILGRLWITLHRVIVYCIFYLILPRARAWNGPASTYRSKMIERTQLVA